MSQKGLSFGRVMPIFALTFVDVLGLTIILPLLHLYAAAFGATPLQIGLAAAAFPLAQIIGVPVMGALSDRYGRKPLLLVSQVSTCISFIMLAGATSLEMVILSRLVDGVFGANLATAQAAITDITDERTRAQGLGMTGAAFGLGFLFGPAIALFALEFSDSLATPALIAAIYSFISILFTLFVFTETLPPNKRRSGALNLSNTLFSSLHILRRAQIRPLMLLMFGQQMVFYGFESLLGLFTLTRLGLLGQGNALIFIYVGFILVYAQARLIGKWSRKYGERWLALTAMGMLAIGLLMFAVTPEQPHPLYVEWRAEESLRDLQPSSAEAIIGDIALSLPDDSARGFGGLLWVLAALVPLGIGAGLIRPALNSLMVKQVNTDERGALLGVSASVVSLADAVAPLLGGLIFQMYGASAPFAVGGVVMAGLLLVGMLALRRETVAVSQAS
jgi:DHA1 family tetracycline resistance protein-like MFS transporter